MNAVAEKPDRPRTRRDSGQVEVVSEQRDDGTYEIKFQSKEIHLERPIDELVAERETIAGPTTSGSPATYAGLTVVVVLLVAGGWFVGG